jgi:glycosyltransferase involved in cell wall biosynthesis
MKENLPLVSIGMAVYNGERTLRPALDALVSQTYPNLEIILSDNASTDQTEAICREFAVHDPRVHYHRNATNIGASANFMRVLDLAQGEFFMWAACDDERPHDAVDALAHALIANERAVMAHGPILLLTPDRPDPILIPNETYANGPSAPGRIRGFLKGVTHSAALYGLYRIDALKSAFWVEGTKADFLHMIQFPLIGPVEHVSTPMIRYSQRFALIDNIIAEKWPLSPGQLLRGEGLDRIKKNKRNRSWISLGRGAYLLMKHSEIDLATRLTTVASYIGAFVPRFPHQLAYDAMYGASRFATRAVRFVKRRLGLGGAERLERPRSTELE